MDNKAFCSELKAFADSKRPEFINRDKATRLADLSEESRAKASALRAQAVGLVIAIGGSADPSAWAKLSRNTVFETYEGQVAIGAAKPNEGGFSGVLNYTLNHYPGIPWRTAEAAEQYFASGGDLRVRRYQSARDYYESCWGSNPNAKFDSFADYCGRNGWPVPSEPVE